MRTAYLDPGHRQPHAIRVLDDEIREKLPIDKRYGTIKFNGKVVTWWDFDTKKPVNVER